MAVAVALLRGINVGGRHSLPMAELRDMLAGLGLEDVRTYIQSGNVVFRSKARISAQLEAGIADAIDTARGFRPAVQIVPWPRWRQAVDANPFPRAVAEPKSLHLYFLAAKPRRPDLAMASELKIDSESFELIERVFYLHTPAGLARSKLANRVEQFLGVSATSRNWRTVEKLTAMASELGNG